MPLREEMDLDAIDCTLKTSAKDIDERKTPSGASAVGASSGTLVAIIANSMPDNNPLKPWLILAAPSVSVLFGAIWVWLRNKVIKYVREREFRLLVSEAKKIIYQELQDSDLSRERQQKLRQMREELNQLEIDRVMVKIKSFKITTERDSSVS
jgi:hypothetical protein